LKHFAIVLIAGIVGLAAGCWDARTCAAAAADEEAVDLILSLLGEEDRDMRALAFQQIREEVPGAAATKKFVAALPKLPPEVQAGLLEALGDRGDPVARPAIVAMLESKEPAVRASALKALGPLGTAEEVPLLARWAAEGSEAEKKAARQSLIRLRAEGMNKVIVAAIEKAPPAQRAALIAALAGRNATEALPAIIHHLQDDEGAVRLAAIGALRALAGPDEAVALVSAVCRAKEAAEQHAAELALLSLASRQREKIAGSVIEGLKTASPQAKASLLRVLARIGNAQALEAIVQCLKDQEQSVRDEAVRLLAVWPDPAVVPHLMALAANSDNLRDQVLVVRALVQLGGPPKGKPADLQLLAEALRLAKRPQEKRLVLGALGLADDPKALSLIAPLLDQDELVEEAALAAVQVAERIKQADKGEVRAVLERVVQKSKNAEVVQRAQKLLSAQ